MGNAATPLPEPEDARVRAFARAVESWREAWLVGRGNPVDRHALIDSGAVSENYIDGLTELANELNGHAEDLLIELRERTDERTARFHSSKADALEEYFRGTGYLDGRETESPGDMWQFVLADLSTELNNGLVTPDDLRAFFDRLSVDPSMS